MEDAAGAFPNLDAMIRQIEAEATKFPGLLAVLSALLKMVIASHADAYLLAGAVVEVSSLRRP